MAKFSSVKNSLLLSLIKLFVQETFPPNILGLNVANEKTVESQKLKNRNIWKEDSLRIFAFAMPFPNFRIRFHFSFHLNVHFHNRSK